VLENLNAAGSSSIDRNTRYGLYLSGDQGHVRIEGCSFIGAAIYPLGYDAVRIQSCTDVAVTRTTGTGGSGSVLPEPQNAPSGAGIVVNQSTVAIYDCTFQGGIGDSAAPSAPAQDGAGGGDGAAVGASTILASGSSFVGGNGGGAGWGQGFSETWGGDGGDGISLDGDSIARLLDDVTTPGFAGPEGEGDGSNGGNNGLARNATPGSLFLDVAGPSKHMLTVTPVRENSVITMTFTGTAGDRVALYFATDADQVWIPTWAGTLLLHVDHPAWAVPVGEIPASGTLQVPWGIADLGGLPSKLLHMQPVFVSAGPGHRKLGNASSMIILSHLY
jgi:hypothetical protein